MKKTVFSNAVVGGAVGEEDRSAADAKQIVYKKLRTILSSVTIFSNTLCTRYQYIRVLVHLEELFSKSDHQKSDVTTHINEIVIDYVF